ncbi:MAG: glutamine synthetase type III, partial [Clostridiales bacterium]|nr:glutamine synthetase type III [Clostridiales bacterium]
KLLRFACSGLGNDQRLGGNEAPPPIISVFLGETLFEKLAEGANVTIEKTHCSSEVLMNNDISALPLVETDDADRNRTSPFAFTGNKFEFRMPGSSQNPDTINMIINTIVAQQLAIIADRLEELGNDEKSVQTVLQELFLKHERVIFNGNNYGKAWSAEAICRGLPIITSSADGIAALTSEKTRLLMTEQGVLTEKELTSRAVVQWEIYIKSLRIEAKTMLDMQRKSILPAVQEYQQQLITYMLQIEKTQYSSIIIQEQLTKIEPLLLSLWENLNHLEGQLSLFTIEATHENAMKWQQEIIPVLDAIRNSSDLLETIVPAKMWPYPTYEELLYY